ncbi:uncharacterized protein [Littorina saxatilis]|uniref:Glycosyltransferase family 92 protein n=1 Tax=Littorina saxatilis TaxID=31220 RepID=A0AAN9BR07_9CAEN
MIRVTFKRLLAIVLVICVGGLALSVWNTALFTGNNYINGLMGENKVTGSAPEGLQRAAAYNVTFFTAEKEASNTTRNETQVLCVEVFPSWTTSDPKDTVFTRRVYLYSAFVALHRAPSTGSYVDIVAFQEGNQLLGLKCCAKIPGQAPSLGGEAAIDFPAMSLKDDPASKDLSVFGLVFRCQFPLTATQLGAGRVTLSTTSCPEDDRVYLPVGLPVKKPGELALCGKVAYGHELDPRRLVEWFEMQRLLGVDKILIYDLNNTETVRKIFSHYRETGLLDPLPYKLPGRNWGRVLAPLNIRSHDESLPIWDCRLRLAGYDYVMGIDMDEVILPRIATRLKPFFNEQFQKHGQTASLFFDVQFFVEEWGPVNSTAPLIFLQYLNSTSPRRECFKYVYIPSRTHQLQTHTVYSYPGHSGMIFLDTNLATIFHYRKCPQGWKSCNPPRITDNNMLRFHDEFVPRALAALKSVGL